MALSIPFERNKNEAVSELKQLLKGAGIVITADDVLGHGVKLHAAYKESSFAIILYFSQKTGKSSKVVLEKETEEAGHIVSSLLTGSAVSSTSTPSNPTLSEVRGQTHIGIDESGKGDYFGPLVIAGVCVSSDDAPKLLQAGVRDSKTLSDKQIVQVATKIRSLLMKDGYNLVHITPEKYNELYSRIKNLNKLLAWGHARVLENLLETNPFCTLAVCDQFGDESYINKAVMEKGKTVKLIQTPKAEQDIAVAAASILARDAFVKKLQEMSERYGVALPKGAATVIEAAKSIVAAHGESELAKVAKLHFKTTARVLKET